MARKLFVHLLVCVGLVLALSSDVPHFDLQEGKTGSVPNPRIADKTFDISDIGSAYWYKQPSDGSSKISLISNFEGEIHYLAPEQGKYDLTATFSLVINNVTHLDEGAYKWQLIPKTSALIEGVVNITVARKPERVEGHISTPQPDVFQDNMAVIIVAIVVVLAVLLGLVIIGIVYGKRRSQRREDRQPESVAMTRLLSAYDQLVHELKEFYRSEMEDTKIHPKDPSRTKKSEDMYIFPDMFKLDNQKREPVKSLKDLEEVLAKNRYVAVMGSAGCGKTALMERIGSDWAHENFTAFKYVVILRKKEILGSTGVLDAIRRLLSSDSEITNKQLKSLIKKNKEKMLMIVDGSFLLESLEDMNNSASEDDWSLKDVLSYNALRGCSLLVTISSHQRDKLRKLYSKYVIVETTGFSPENIKDYIHQFFEHSDEGNRLIEKVESSEIIKTLAKSPIMLQVLCLIWEQDNSLPSQIANVYDRAVNVLVSHISPNGCELVDVNWMKEIKQSIGEVAFGGLHPEEERSNFSPDDFSDESRQFGLSIGVMSQETHTTAELQTRVVKFLHLYQDYFAACFLVHGNVERELLPRVTCDSVRKMEMLIRFCCGMDDSARVLIVNHLQGLEHDLGTSVNVAWVEDLISNPSGY